MGRLEMKNVQRKKDGRLYFRRKVNGQDTYHRLPDIDDPSFAARYAELSRPETQRLAPLQGTIGAMVIAYKQSTSFKRLSEKTKADRTRYLDMIAVDHGHRSVKGCTRPMVRKMRDVYADTPGKANVWLVAFRCVMEQAIEAEIIRENPARGIEMMELGEHEPWPADVLERALAAASPMLRLAIITGLCSGARIGDAIKMQHGWHDRQMMTFTTSKRVGKRREGKQVHIPMHPLWVAEIDKHQRNAITLLYDRAGKPFSDTDIVQERVRRLMEQIGSPTYETNGRQRGYSFHGLRKNAACYLAELGLSEDEIGIICAMTPETVRHYTKRKNNLMIAQGIASRVTRGDVLPLKGGQAKRSAK